MSKLWMALALGLSLTLGVAHAGPQQEKMKTCNKEAGDKKGDERKAFMKQCLSAKGADAAPSAAAKPSAPAAGDKKKAQQEKMKSCNKEAGDKKGDERKKFMATCLKA